MPILLQSLSHSPLMDLHAPRPDVEREARAAVGAARERMAAFDPELVVLIAPDHFNGFFHDLMPPFCIGVEAEAIGDYGTAAGRIAVAREEALALAQDVLDAEFDVAVSYRMQVDHGFAQPLELLLGGLGSVPAIPVFVNAVGVPRPSFRRTRLLGEAIGRSLRARWAERRVAVVASGGLSHDPPVPSIAGAPPEVAERLIAGRNPPAEARRLREDRTVAAARAFANGSERGGGELLPLNPDWDRMLVELFRSGRLDRVDGFKDEWITAEGGRGGHEIRSWVAAFACLSAFGPYEAELDYYRAVPEWIAGFTLMHGRPALAA